jgi:diguanylate cyclase (GGDEF)-like protein/PAS domain S-box-containing protein
MQVSRLFFKQTVTRWLRQLNPRVASTWVGVFLMGVSVLIVLVNQQHQRMAAQQQIKQLAQVQVNVLRVGFDRQMSVFDLLALAVQHETYDVDHLSKMAESLQSARPHLRVIGLAYEGKAWQPLFVTADMHNAAQVYRALSASPMASVGSAEKIEVRGPWVDGAKQILYLVQVPVWSRQVNQSDEKKQLAVVSAVVSLDGMLQTMNMSWLQTQGLDYEVRQLRPWYVSAGVRDNVVIIPARQNQKLTQYGVQLISSVHGVDFMLSIGPANVQVIWLKLAGLIAAVMLLSVLMAWGVYQWLQQFQFAQSVLKNLTDHLPGVLYQYRMAANDHSWFAYVSGQVKAVLGLDAELLKDNDQTWRDIIHADDRRLLRLGLEQSARTLAPFDVTIRIQKPGVEGIFWLSIVAQPQREVDGTIVWNGYISDCTKDKLIHNELTERGLLLKEAQEVARLGYLEMDAATGHWSGSDVMYDILGVDASFARTRENAMRMVHKDHVALVEQTYARALRIHERVSLEFQMIRPMDGRIIWIDADVRMEFHADGAPRRLVGSVQEITDRKQAEADIRYLAYYDVLTGLPNRRLLTDQLGTALTARMHDRQTGAVLFFDLDHFKDLNDSLGHERGDALLRMVAIRLLGCKAEGDLAARFGGDEFVLLVPVLPRIDQESATDAAQRLADRVVGALSRPYQFAGVQHTITPSVGLALFTDDRLTADELIKRADMAMYQAKGSGRNTMRFFDPQIQMQLTERLNLAEELRDAIRSGQLRLVYQPQHNHLGHLIGAEALLRWQHPVRGAVSPAVFVPLAEQVGLMHVLGQWVLRMACDQLGDWLAHRQLAPLWSHFALSVNVSAHQFRSPDFVTFVKQMVQQAHLPANVLKLELTESLMVHDVEDIIVKMTEIQQMGVGFSLDDFGTGYSSLTYLKRLPLEQLKIDQSFVRDVLVDAHDAGIAQTVVALGQILGLSVIAEGVETQAQRELLADIGCQKYQGYLFSRPLEVDDFVAYAISHLMAEQHV